MIHATQHDRQIFSDYEMLRSFNIRTVRDGICWPLIERSGWFDFASLNPMLESANQHGIQIIWNIFHYGCPDDVDIFSPSFIDRFARYCTALARYIADHSDRVPFYTPINEISFLAWGAGEVGYIHPFGLERGTELKRQLIRAAIAGIESLWDVDPRARIVQVEPGIHVIAPRDRPDLAESATVHRASQFEAWDMMIGQRDPSLGGQLKYLDIMGLNYYSSNQWEFSDVRLGWEENLRDERWLPLHDLLAEVYDRYQRPLFIGETSHFGVGRGAWLKEVYEEVQTAIRHGVPIEGITIYPIIDRPDWDNPDHWHNSGLWDLVPDEHGNLQRVLNEEYAVVMKKILREAAIPEQLQDFVYKAKSKVSLNKNSPA
jgi:beta-glucosidase/6-phospho-beta-glucosidase/beta-galactosidase